MILGSIGISNLKLGIEQVKKVMLGGDLVWSSLVESQVLLYNSFNMPDFTELTNVEIVSNELVAVTIDTTNIIDTAEADSFTTLTKVVGDDIVNIDGTDIVVSGVSRVDIGEIVDEDFSVDTNNWTVSVSSKSLDSERMRVTNTINATGFAYIEVSTVIGKDYTLIGDLIAGNKDAGLYIFDSTLDIANNLGGTTVQGLAKQVAFTATETSSFVVCRVQSATSGDNALFDNIYINTESTTYTVPTPGVTATTAYLNQYTATIGTPIDQGVGEMDFAGLAGLADGYSTEFQADLEFADISVNSTVDVLNTLEPIADGDNLVIVLDDNSINETVASGVNGTSPYSMPYIGMTATSKAYKVDDVPSFDIGANGMQEAVKLSDDYIIEDLVSSSDPFGDGNLISKYEFEDNTNDTLGINNATSSALSFASGLYGQCASFNGVSSEVLNSMSTSATVTFSFSVKLTSATVVQVLAEGSAGSSYSVYADGADLNVRRSINDSNKTIPDLLESGVWSHLVISMEPGGLTVYKDGSLVYSDSDSVALVLSTYFGFGYRPSTNQHYMEGLMDQVEIYDRKLTENEAFQLYTQLTNLKSTRIYNQLLATTSGRTLQTKVALSAKDNKLSLLSATILKDG